MFPICRSLRVMSWLNIRGLTWEPESSLIKRKRQWNLARGFCMLSPLSVCTGINRQQLHPHIRFLLRSRVNEHSSEIHQVNSLCCWKKRLFWLALRHNQLIQWFPWVLHLKKQFLFTEGTRLFKDAVQSVSSWLRSFPILRLQPRSLSSVSGHLARWSCVRGWFMHSLWVYDHGNAAIVPLSPHGEGLPLSLPALASLPRAENRRLVLWAI